MGDLAGRARYRLPGRPEDHDLAVVKTGVDGGMLGVLADDLRMAVSNGSLGPFTGRRHLGQQRL